MKTFAVFFGDYFAEDTFEKLEKTKDEHAEISFPIQLGLRLDAYEIEEL